MCESRFQVQPKSQLLIFFWHRATVWVGDSTHFPGQFFWGWGRAVGFFSTLVLRVECSELHEIWRGHRHIVAAPGVCFRLLCLESGTDPNGCRCFVTLCKPAPYRNSLTYLLTVNKRTWTVEVCTSRLGSKAYGFGCE